MRASNFLRALVALLSIFLSSRVALADDAKRVIVVETSGAIDDDNALRSAIGTELRATVLAPDDPHAASASGTLAIDIRASDKRITATYRSLGAPVARTVDMPDDPKRARSVAVLLAGNVAREEADDLLAAMKKNTAPEAPVTTGKVDASEDARRLHAVLDQLGESNHDRRKWVAIASLVEGGLSAGVGTYYLLKEPHVADTRNAGSALVGHGVVSGLIGGILLAGPNETYEQLTRELEKAEKTSAPEDAVRRVEAKWAEAASDARSFRKVAGWLAAGVGLAGAGTGLALPALVPSGQQDSSVPIAGLALVAVGGLYVAVGIDLLFDESGIEQSWHVYRQMKQFGAQPTRTATLRPKVGVAPLPGGGMASLGFAF